MRLAREQGSPSPEYLKRDSVQWLHRVSVPHPWEAGCTWSRRKEGEEVRLQEFPAALFAAEVMRGGGGRRGPPVCPLAPKGPGSPLSPITEEEVRPGEGREPPHSPLHPHSSRQTGVPRGGPDVAHSGRHGLAGLWKVGTSVAPFYPFYQ